MKFQASFLKRKSKYFLYAAHITVIESKSWEKLQLAIVDSVQSESDYFLYLF